MGALLAQVAALDTVRLPWKEKVYWNGRLVQTIVTDEVAADKMYREFFKRLDPVGYSNRYERWDEIKEKWQRAGPLDDVFATQDVVVLGRVIAVRPLQLPGPLLEIAGTLYGVHQVSRRVIGVAPDGSTVETVVPVYNGVCEVVVAVERSLPFYVDTLTFPEFCRSNFADSCVGKSVLLFLTFRPWVYERIDSVALAEEQSRPEWLGNRSAFYYDTRSASGGTFYRRDSRCIMSLRDPASVLPDALSAAQVSTLFDKYVGLRGGR